MCRRPAAACLRALVGNPRPGFLLPPRENEGGSRLAGRQAGEVRDSQQEGGAFARLRMLPLRVTFALCSTPRRHS